MADSIETNEFPLVEENKVNASAIKDILAVKGHKMVNKYVLQRSFANEADPAQWVNLTALQERIDGYEIGQEVVEIPNRVPDTFVFPVYELTTQSNRRDVDYKPRATTLHGILDEYFIGSDGLAYVAMNSLLFNEEGQAVKAELIVRHGDPKNIWFSGLDLSTIKREDFVPKTGLRFVPLDPHDYEKAHYFLHGIQEGRFKEV